PGLDESLADKAWANVGEQHPQGAMKRLLDRARAPREAVATWPASRRLGARGRWRRRLVNEALLPAADTADWLHVIDKLRSEGKADGADAIAGGLAGLSVVSARHEEEAATVAALLLREALETPGLTAALVTPDQTMARRVSARLARWGVAPDSSAGQALAGTPAAVLAALVAGLAADPLDPVRLLATLKHPLARLGLSETALAEGREALERAALRGPRKRAWADIEAALAKVSEGRLAAERLSAALQPLQSLFAEEVAPAQAARVLATTMEALAADEAGGAGGLWTGHGGEAMSRLIAALIHDGGGLPPVSARGFADLLRRLVDGENVR